MNAEILPVQKRKKRYVTKNMNWRSISSVSWLCTSIVLHLLVCGRLRRKLLSLVFPIYAIWGVVFPHFVLYPFKENLSFIRLQDTTQPPTYYFSQERKFQFSKRQYFHFTSKKGLMMVIGVNEAIILLCSTVPAASIVMSHFTWQVSTILYKQRNSEQQIWNIL